MKSSILSALLLAAVAAAPAVAQPIPADVVTVGTVSGAAGATVDVPVYIRDLSGTALGIDQPPGSRIQSYGLTVNYAPATSVQSVTFTRGGITVPLTPTFESSPSSPGTITLIDTFQESTNLIPFVSNAPAPGNQVGTLHVAISPTAPIPSIITLTLDPTLTQLSNQAGTTKETVTLANLVLVAGAINITGSIPALSPWLLALLAIALAVVAVPMLRRG
jgi:hypothetical protein